MIPSAEAEIARLANQLRENPRSTAFVALAELLRRAGRPSDALATLREGERHCPDYAPARVVLAKVQLDLGQRALAVRILDDVVALDPENLAGLALAARLYAEDGRGEELAPLLARLRIAGGEEAELAGLLARDLERPGQRPRSMDPLDGPDLADRLAARGATSAALAMWRRLAGADPSHPLVRERIATLSASADAVELAPLAPPPTPAGARALRRWAERVFPGVDQG